MKSRIEKLRGVKKAKFPGFVKPMLAKLTHDYFSSNDWIYERKLDGERVIAVKKDKVELYSRNGKKLNSQYPEIVEELKNSGIDSFIFDGEIVAFDKGKTSFSKLQERMHRLKPKKEIKIYYYIFDLVYFLGYSLEKVSLENRKRVLGDLKFKGKVRCIKYKRKEGEEFLEGACRRGWEGVIAKNLKSKYKHSRSSDWLKFKCSKGQEFVILGYTKPRKSRKYFGALLLGYYENSKLRYAGKVGTGFDEKTLRFLYGKMGKLKRKTSSLSKGGLEKVDEKKENINWISPKLVAEVKFTEFTSDNKLRHPRYVGLREDKKAKNVKREK